jgi:hypothetical protein
MDDGIAENPAMRAMLDAVTPSSVDDGGCASAGRSGPGAPS